MEAEHRLCKLQLRVQTLVKTLKIELRRPVWSPHRPVGAGRVGESVVITL